MIKGLIFDFDGLILDTEEPDFRSWHAIYAEHGLTLTLDDWAGCIGAGYSTNGFDPYDALEERLGRPIDRAALRQRHRSEVLGWIAAQPVLPGVEEYLREARDMGLMLGVASSSHRDWVAGHLERLGLAPYFDCLRCAGEVQRTKPHPDLYLAVLDDLGLASCEAIALEDAPHGVTAARNAGIFCVAVPNPITAQLGLGHADLVVSSLAELPLRELLELAQTREITAG